MPYGLFGRLGAYAEQLEAAVAAYPCVKTHLDIDDVHGAVRDLRSAADKQNMKAVAAQHQIDELQAQIDALRVEKREAEKRAELLQGLSARLDLTLSYGGSYVD